MLLSLRVNPSAPQPVYLFIGESARGKTTFRDIVCEQTNSKGASCSDAIFDTWSALSGRSVKELRAMPKELIRPKLRELGDWMVGARDFPHREFPEVSAAKVAAFLEGGFVREPTALVKWHLDNGVRALDGIRRQQEYDLAVERIRTEGFRPVVIWVETTRDMSHVTPDNFALTKDRCKPDLVIHNDGKLADVRKDHGPALDALIARALTPEPVAQRVPATPGYDEV